MFTVRNVTIGEGKPKLSVAISSKDMTHLIMDASHAFESDAEIIEWRADVFPELLDDSMLLRALNTIRKQIQDKILLFTIRTKEEGGELVLKDDEYIHAIKTAISSKLVDMIDVECCVSEYRALEVIPFAVEHNIAVIGSNYSLDKMLSEDEMEFRIRYMQRLGVSMVRLTVCPDRKSATYKLLNDIYSITNTMDFPVSIMGAGQEGKIVKVFSEFFGNSVVFTEQNPKDETELDLKKAADLINAINEL